MGTAYTPELSPTGTDYRVLHEIFSYDLHYEVWFSNLPQTMKAELDERRPILYDALPSEGDGHALVVDGYTSNNYFHFNYGWGGYCDGFYKDGVCKIYNINPSITIGIRPSNAIQKEIGSYKYDLRPDSTAEIVNYLGGGMGVQNGVLEIP